MNANALNFDIEALTAPKCTKDLIALASEIRAEFAAIRAHMDQIMERGKQPAAA